MQVTTKDIIELLCLMADETTVEGDGVLVTELDLYIKPEIDAINEYENMASATLYFWVWSSLFGEEPFFECSTAVGQNAKEAVHNAVTGFILGAMCGLRHFAKDEMEYRLMSEYAGVSRGWMGAGSCGVIMGERAPNMPVVWDLIKERLPSRLGARPVYYVKTYACKQPNGEVIGELRINNNVDKELSKLLANAAKEWDTGGKFSSQKEFFFLRQDAQSYRTPYPFSQKQLQEFTADAVALFRADTDDDSFVENLMEKTGDRDLAVELHSLLPEMCAEHAFPELNYPDAFQIHNASGTIAVYKSQLYSYFPILKALFDGFSQQLFTNDDYKKMALRSSISRVYNQVREQNEDLSKCGISTVIMVPDDYQLR